MWSMQCFVGPIEFRPYTVHCGGLTLLSVRAGLILDYIISPRRLIPNYIVSPEKNYS